MAKAVFCIAASEFQAEAIVNEAKVAGFTDDEISVLLPDRAGTLSQDWTNKAQSALGWLTGIGPINIPGLGPFIAAGPIMAALTGASAGSSPGGIRAVLDSMGIPEEQSRNYEQKVIASNILIFFLSENLEQTNRALAIFRQAGAEDIAVTGEVATQPRPPEVRDERWEKW